MRRHRRARPCRSVAWPPAARTFCTQLDRSPSIGTRYHSPFQSAIPSGKRVTRPERRPVTSSVTQRSGASPRPNTAAHSRDSRRAVASARPPGYMARSLFVVAHRVLLVPAAAAARRSGLVLPACLVLGWPALRRAVAVSLVMGPVLADRPATH